MDADRFFSHVWPDLARRLAAYLAGLGVPVSDREDLVQETALRVYRAWGSVDLARPIEPFIRTIAANAWRDQLRRTCDAASLCELGERPSREPDVEDVVAARWEVHRVARALTCLSLRQRELILAAGSSPVPARSSASVRMARSRARRALRTALDTSFVAVGGAARSTS